MFTLFFRPLVRYPGSIITFVAIANALQCDANQLLSNVLDVTTSQESASISRKLQALPVDEQRRLLRVLEVMIDER